LQAQQASAVQALRRHFPGCAIAIPRGGYFLWIELAQDVDTLELHRLALQANISIAPGPMFSARRQFRNCLRINSGHVWTPQVERAVAELGKLVRQLQR